MSWLADTLIPLHAIAKELGLIRTQLTRIANVHEGHLPPRAAVPEAPDEPLTLAPASTDAQFAQIEAIENRYLAISGRLPTAEEICRELDGEEIPVEVSAAAIDRHHRMRQSSHGD